MENTCKLFAKCPIHSGVLQHVTTASANYSRKFCTAGEAGWLKCKRFQVNEQSGGMCPPDILPNSKRKVEDIISEMNMMIQLHKKNKASR
jgi:hypothetical protein